MVIVFVLLPSDFLFREGRCDSTEPSAAADRSDRLLCYFNSASHSEERTTQVPRRDGSGTGRGAGLSVFPQVCELWWEGLMALRLETAQPTREE